MCSSDLLMFLMEARHLELDEALKRGGEILGPGGEPVSPRMHVMLHVVVANQLLGNNPPETWQTVQRLAGLGYDWHNVMHMIMGPVGHSVYQTLAGNRSFDRAEYVRMLSELPGDWPPPEELG